MTTPNPFELLGFPLRFDISKKDIDARLRDLSKVLHPDRHTQAPVNERRAALNRAIGMNEAVRVLKDPVSRGHALLAVLEAAPSDEARVDQLFLLEVMELREALTAAQSAADQTAVRDLGQRALAAERAVVSDLTEHFAALETAGAERRGAVRELIQAGLAKLKYWQRLTEEVKRIEAEQD